MRDATLKPSWPEGYGFKISGSGPSYVIAVERESIAYRSGISAGDQLVEVDGLNVCEMSAEAIKSLTRRTHSDPPTLGLVSRVQYKEVTASRRWGYGFTPVGVRPTVVAAVDPPGPAYQAGIREGDIILEVNGKELKSLKHLESILQTQYGKLRLAVLPGMTRPNHKTSETRAHHSKGESDKRQKQKTDGNVTRAQDLFLKLNQVLGSDYERKMTVVGLIKNYAKDRDIEKLAAAVNRVLVSQHHRVLLREIRSFVPLKHRSSFDHIVDSGKFQGLSISTVSPSDRTQSACHKIEPGTGLLAIANPSDKYRSVLVSRHLGGFGFVLRGHHPVCVESVSPEGPAHKAGLQPGDQITAVNGVDVRKCSHSELVKILQSSGDRPLLQVKQPPPHNGSSGPHVPHPLYASDSAFSRNTQQSGSTWLNDSGLTLDGHTFRQKVDLLLTDREKMSLRLALIEFNINRNITQLVDDVQVILDTPAKQALWLFILHRMGDEHRQYISKYKHLPERFIKEILSDETLRSERSNTAITKSAYTTDFLSSGLISSSMESQPTSPSKPFKQQPMKSGKSFKQPMKISESLKQQMEYLLTSRERYQIEQALRAYSLKKNLERLLEEVSDILDTASKQTLWFHLIHRLDPRHRSRAESMLGLPRGHFQDRTTPSIHKNDQRHQSAVFPKYGDILYLQKQFVGSFLASRNQHHNEMLSSDEDLDDLGPLHSDCSSTPHIHTPSTLSSDTSLNPRKEVQAPPVQGRFGLRPVYMNERNYSSDVEQATMVLNPVYAEIDHSRGSSLSSQTVPKVKMVRESAAQTTPVSTPVPPPSAAVPSDPIHLTDLSDHTPNHQADFRTIVKVYEGQQKTPDIVTVFDARNSNNNSSDALDDDSDNAGLDDLQCTNIDDFEVPGSSLNAMGLVGSELASQHPVRYGFKHSMGNSINGETFAKKDGSQTRQYSKPTLHSPGTSNLDNASSKSSHSLDSSYQSRALDALKALDDVVGDVGLSSTEGDSELDDIEGDTDGASSDGFMAVPTPPPPPPAPPVLLPEESPYKSSLKLNVKRINWEKINNPSEHTVWAKIERDTEDLEEMVKYLELEQQFSTKHSKVTECFRERKTEQYILSPKKAYNISILLGHLKKDTRVLKQALLDMNESILTPELLHQLLQYMPDSKELADYAAYTGSVEDLSQPDQFIYLLTRVPRYKDRLQAISFKLDFSDKVMELTKNLQVLRQASAELKQSTELSRVLEIALAMGNYMNQGSSRVGEAAGFRLNFLQRIDLTKTSDGKGSFLSVLAKAVWNKYPETIAFRLHLPSLHEAVKVSLTAVEADTRQLKSGIQDVSDTVSLLHQEGKFDPTDRFQDVIEHFVSQASDEMQGLYSLQKTTVEDLHDLLTYFGEDHCTTDPSLVFQVISDFSAKFERARQNLLGAK